MSDTTDINHFRVKKEAESFADKVVNDFMSKEDVPHKNDALASILSHSDVVTCFYRDEYANESYMEASSPEVILHASKTSTYIFEPIPEINTMKMVFDEHQYSIIFKNSLSRSDFNKHMIALDNECRDNQVIAEHNKNMLQLPDIKDRVHWEPEPFSINALIETLKVCQAAEAAMFNKGTNEVYHVNVPLKDLVALAKTTLFNAGSSFTGQRFNLVFKSQDSELIVNLRAKDGLLSRHQFNKVFDGLQKESKKNHAYVRENDPNKKLFLEGMEEANKMIASMMGDDLERIKPANLIDKPNSNVENSNNDNVVSMRPRMK